MRLLLAAVVAALCLLPCAAAAAVLPATPATLTTVFKGAACGDVISLAPGVVTRWRPGTPMQGTVARDCSANPVVIAAADFANPPVFTAGWYVRASDGAKIASAGVTMDGFLGVTFLGVACDVSAGGFGHAPCFSAAGSANAAISIEDSLIFGRSDPTVDVNGAAELGGIGYGIAGKYQGLRVVRNTFRDLPKGIVLGDSSDVLVADNDMFRITTDGFQFGGLVRGQFLRNLIITIALPDASTAHPDCGQGLKGGRPSVDVIIAFNLCRGPAAGKLGQGFFVADEALNNNIRLEGNTVLNRGYRAISVQALTAAANDNVALSERTTDYAGLYWAAGSGEVRGNTANLFNNVPAGSLGNVTVARSTTAEIDAAQAAWLAKFRAAPEPPTDPSLELKARIDRLLAERGKALDLAKQARAARAKNQYIDQLIALLSAPAP